MTTTDAVPPIPHPAPAPAPVPRPPERDPGPRWARPALYGLLLAVGLAYFWNLSASGYANSFYSAAVQAGSQSWKALFFGSLDSGGAITVDKPPAALWPMALSVRLFGLDSWAILAPQVLMALATAAVLNTAVRRRFGPVAGLIAVGVFALTPVAALMFRFNNPDALLALLMTVTVWCVLRALEQGRTKWLLWAGAAVGFAFLTKTLQAFLILPPPAVLYAVCAPVSVRKRLGQLALSALTMVVAGGWWVAIVELMPASARPYVGGSQNNSFLELTFGYNGLGRINGEETGSVGGGGGGGGRGGGGGGGWGETGIGRMFNSEVGGQIAWLLPAALILLAAGLWLTRKAARTDSARAAFVAWGGALLMTAAVFSFMAGIFHQYYTVALAPYVAALVAMGVTVLWEERGAWWPRAVLAGTVLVTVVWAYVLLGRTPDYLPWLRWAVLAGGLVGALGLLVVGRLGGRGLGLVAVAVSCAASLAGPTAYTVSTLNSGHQGSIVTAGPSAGGFGMGGPGGGGGPGGPGGGDGGQRGGMRQPPGQGQGQGQNRAQGTPPGQGQGQGQGQGNQQGNAPGGMPTAPGGTAPGGTGAGFGEGVRGGGGGGGMGGLLNGASVDAEAKALLEKGADDYTWVAAAVGAQNAASYQLATGEPVMAIGGFNGSDPSPTPAQFKEYVAQGKVHYFVPGGGMGGDSGSSSTSSQISSWVTENFEEVTVGGSTFYDLTQPVA